MKIKPEDVHLVPSAIKSAAGLRRHVGLEELAAANPRHELFVLWFRQDPSNPFALVLRVRVDRGSDNDWPLYCIDRETRVLEFNEYVPLPPLPPEPAKFTWPEVPAR